MTEQAKAKRPAVDWEAVERDYRAGFMSLREIAEQHPGTNHVAIARKAKKEGWEKNLSEKIAARTDALVTQQTVTAVVTEQSRISERQTIEASAQMMADKVLNQREDIKQARAIVQRLWAIVDAELNHPVEFADLGELMRAPDEFGQDKLNDMYRAAIALPQQVKNVKLLADALKVLIELERKVLRIKDDPEPAATLVLKADPTLSPAEAYMRMLGK